MDRTFYQLLAALNSQKKSEKLADGSHTHTHTDTAEDAPMSHCDTNPAVTQQQICRHARIQRGCSESRAAPTGKESLGLHEKRVSGGTRKALIAGKTR